MSRFSLYAVRAPPIPTVAIACHQLVDADTAHPTVQNHPEAAVRIRACLAGLSSHGLWRQLHALPRRLALDSELQLCHDIDHLQGLETAVGMAREAGHALFLPPTGRYDDFLQTPLLSHEIAPGAETYIAAGSMVAARASVGGLLSLVDEVLRLSHNRRDGKDGRIGNYGGVKCESDSNLQTAAIRRGICLSRPPGHHAGRSRSDGFCLVNNVAVAATYARQKYPSQVQRVAIIDWDVHHGQGTQDIFWKDPSTLFFSIHCHDDGFYPGSGKASEVGEGPGLGSTINVPLPAGYGDASLWDAFSKVLLPAVRNFHPDLIIVSAGFDAAAGDPLGGGRCTPRGFGAITQELRRMAAELCSGRLLLALEGGYQPACLADCIADVVRALVVPDCDDTASLLPFAERPSWLGAASRKERAAIAAVRARHVALASALAPSSPTASKILRPAEALCDAREDCFPSSLRTSSTMPRSKSKRSARSRSGTPPAKPRPTRRCRQGLSGASRVSCQQSKLTDA
eukprot:TRINITY_DN74410_c0_g1_i1.p1 TRINITY_DN74410_c0_g1~~TRINITY_DN74410_c0_g1_i1.p1  ORF type:complete len:513 (-),score=65.78 TRINITY_DN74410_c0_g1_i1:98-1636(-)